jgi:ABC-type nitrate/sulfonate/bicarbonate transport system substrate-binding protein
VNRRGVLVALTSLSATVRTVSAQPAAARMTVALTTRSASDWGMEVAQRLGYFAALGLTVEQVYVGSSSGVAQQITGGSAEIGSVSTTQIVQAVVGGAPLVDVFRNVTTTPYTVFGRKGLTSVAQLRGKTIMVGGPNDITRVFMDKVLAAYQLTPDDVTYTFAGGPAERYAALLNGAVEATLFNPPVTFRAIDDGYPILDEVSKYFPGFPTNGFAVRADWAKAHRDQLFAFLRGFLQGTRWVYAPANRARAVGILQEVDGITVDVAQRTYEMFVQRGRLLSLAGRFERNDFPQVIDALVRMKQLQPPLPDSNRFYDNTYVDAAAATLK